MLIEDYVAIKRVKAAEKEAARVAKLFKMAEVGALPPEFSDWWLTNEDNEPLACHAARFGKQIIHPLGLSARNPRDWTAAHILAYYGTLPITFENWGCRGGPSHLTVAHIYAERGKLSAKFRDWFLADTRSWTVAHSFVKHCPMPLSFKDWHLATDSGWTVAHVAATYRRLPSGFEQWGLEDKRGVTVREIAEQSIPPLPKKA